MNANILIIDILKKIQYIKIMKAMKFYMENQMMKGIQKSML